ncbi:MAG: hypothetical protein GX444_06570 [Myxococcales bacterium]|nr:hypothetical protein [Myxococcales bacterium]
MTDNESTKSSENGSKRSGRRMLTAWRVFFLAFLLLLAAGFFYRAATPVDDAYITYRYADNLMHGRGISFNPGERVEGYTSFGQLLLIAPFTLLGKNVVRLWSILLGLAAGAGLVALVWRRIDRERGPLAPDRPEWFAVLYLSLCTPLVIWAWSGMETVLFTFLWVAAWSAHLNEYENDRRPWLSGLLTFAAGLLHPEGVLIGLVLGASWLWPFDRRRANRAAVYFAASWGLFGLYWLWRWHYFGYLLPNTFYAKVGTTGGLIASGLIYVSRSIASGILPLVLAVELIRQRRSARGWPRWLRLALGLIAVLLAYVIWVGGDYFAFGRFLLPIYPFVVLAVWKLWTDRRAAAKPAAPGSLPWLWAAIVVAVLAVWSNLIPPGHMFQHKLLQRAVEDYVIAGAAARRAVPAEATVATIPIGAFGFYSERRILDLMGLTDLHLAHLPIATGQRVVGHEKYDYGYVFEQQPEIILQLPALFAKSPDGLRNWMHKTMLNPQQYTMYNYPELAANYRLCWLPAAAPAAKKRAEALGVYAYLRQDRIGRPGYQLWNDLPEEMAQTPLREYRDIIAENQRRFGNRRLGMWKFSSPAPN